MYTYAWITQEFDPVGMPVRFYMRTLQNSFFFCWNIFRRISLTWPDAEENEVNTIVIHFDTGFLFDLCERKVF